MEIPFNRDFADKNSEASQELIASILGEVSISVHDPDAKDRGYRHSAQTLCRQGQFRGGSAGSGGGASGENLSA